MKKESITESIDSIISVKIAINERNNNCPMMTRSWVMILSKNNNIELRKKERKKEPTLTTTTMMMMMIAIMERKEERKKNRKTNTKQPERITRKNRVIHHLKYSTYFTRSFIYICSNAHSYIYALEHEMLRIGSWNTPNVHYVCFFVKKKK